MRQVWIGRCMLCLLIWLSNIGNLKADDSGDSVTIIDAVLTSNFPVVSNFVAQGGNVNIQDSEPLRRESLLMYAVHAQSPEICRMLLDNGAKVEVQSKAGFTALMLARQHYESSLPESYEKLISAAERRLTTVKDKKYIEKTKKRLKYYKKKLEEADTSKEAQARAQRIVKMLEKKVLDQKKKKSSETDVSPKNK